ncbi:leukocyte immunoglobulin-like receptor subfamily A member 2 [Pipistrellus kuhlii]|uniref:leukocyte immunoglobulin-like receptor subfamily A member 2 n=1 Tax=Pipistrellus kuhlii TaxID=59472 RepID=UPI001E26F8A1|nr:leukocyte immunoglobulin-like receptor subfamily A member 2 [Pipistrellus kuhlii]
MVTVGSPVSIWCRGSRKADQYHLHQERAPQPLRTVLPQGPRDTAEFPIPRVTHGFAGRYHCTYNRWRASSAPSEPLDLVVTGMFNPPTLSALPSPVVTSEGSVTLQCGSWQGFDWFYLSDKGRGGHHHLYSQRRDDGWSQALLTVGPVRPTHWWAYRCYGVFSGSPYVWSSPSSLVELLILGVSRKPSLSVLPGPVVAPGDTLILQCQSDVNHDRFALFKMGEHDLPQELGRQPQAGLSQVDFSLGPVSVSHGGRYRCYSGYNLSSEWSAPSDPVDILVTALFPQDTLPTLSAHPGPTMAPGENVTLRCQTASLFDTFLLFKEGDVGPPLHLRSQYQDGVFQANFPMNPVTLDHWGTYRCYGSLNSTPIQLSSPSNPLELKVEGEELSMVSSCLPTPFHPSPCLDHLLQ